MPRNLQKLKQTFRMDYPLEKGLWPRLVGHYSAAAEIREFWANIVTIWFYNIRPGWQKPGWQFETPEEFIAYDPVVGELITECFVYAPFYEWFSADYAIEKGYIAAPEVE